MSLYKRVNIWNGFAMQAVFHKEVRYKETEHKVFKVWWKEKKDADLERIRKEEEAFKASLNVENIKKIFDEVRTLYNPV